MQPHESMPKLNVFSICVSSSYSVKYVALSWNKIADFGGLFTFVSVTESHMLKLMFLKRFKLLYMKKAEN